MRENRRKKSVLAALVSDPYRKLAAIAMALGLWWFLDTQVTKDVKPRLVLKAVNQVSRSPDLEPGNTLLVNLPTDIVSLRGFVNPATERPLTEVEVRFEGPKYLIDNLREPNLILTVGPFADRKWDEIAVLEFTAADIRRTDRILLDVSIEMDPPRVRVNLEKNEPNSFPLKPDLVDFQFRNAQDEALRPRLREDRAEFSKDVVSVIGPKSRLKNFLSQGGRPFVTILDPINRGRDVGGTLAINSTDDSLVLDTQVSIRIELIPVHEDYTLEIPILVDDLALRAELRGRYRPDQPTKIVRIKASGELGSRLVTEADKDLWARQHLRLAVWIPPRGDEEVIPKELVLVARLELRGDLGNRVDPVHYLLDEAVSVTLVRQ